MRKALIVLLIIISLISIGFFSYQWNKYNSEYYVSVGVQSATGVVLNVVDSDREIRLTGNELNEFLKNWSAMFEPSIEVLCHTPVFSVTFEYPYGNTGHIDGLCFSCSNMTTSSHSPGVMLFQKYSIGATAVYLTLYKYYPDMFSFDAEYFFNCLDKSTPMAMKEEFIESGYVGLVEEFKNLHMDFADLVRNGPDDSKYHEETYNMSVIMDSLLLLNYLISTDEDYKNDVLVQKVFTVINPIILQMKSEVAQLNTLMNKRENANTEMTDCLDSYASLLKWTEGEYQPYFNWLEKELISSLAAIEDTFTSQEELDNKLLHTHSLEHSPYYELRNIGEEGLNWVPDLISVLECEKRSGIELRFKDPVDYFRINQLSLLCIEAILKGLPSGVGYDLKANPRNSKGLMEKWWKQYGALPSSEWKDFIHAGE
ncbi:MAG: hypothetical protein HRU15_03150 [Planctomycetes bacterium]|nr:hypothetical protein [Planctomycetota bacterium]